MEKYTADVINKIVTEIPKNPATVLNSASLNIA
jgi:hypothetical protein